MLNCTFLLGINCNQDLRYTYFLCRYLYTGTFDQDEVDVMDILYLARKYMLPQLVDDCVQLAKHSIDDNLWHILTKSLQNQEEAICEACLTYIRLNEDFEYTAWNMNTFIKRSSLEFVLENAMVNVKEEEIVRFCTRWAKRLLRRQKKDM